MTRDDAFLYLPHKAEDDIEEIYQERLFDFKQKVLSIAPSTKLYQLHINKMALVYKAYLFFTQLEEANLTLKYQIIVSQENLKNLWKNYNKNKNEIKLMLVNSNSFKDIEYLIGGLLKNQIQFASFFKDLNLIKSSPIIISKELEAMQLDAAIDDFILKGYSNIKDIEKLDSTNILFQEVNRLSLWLNTEKNDR